MADLPYRVALVIVPSSDNQVRMIRGVLQYAAETSRIQIIKQAAIPYVPWDQLTEVQPDGIIAFAETQARIDFLRELNIPFVNVTMHIDPTPEVAVVHSDNLEIGRRLADHLQSLGLKHFAFVGHNDWCHNRLRRDGFLQQLSAMGHTAQVIEVALNRIAQATSRIAASIKPTCNSRLQNYQNHAASRLVTTSSRMKWSNAVRTYERVFLSACRWWA